MEIILSADVVMTLRRRKYRGLGAIPTILPTVDGLFTLRDFAFRSSAGLSDRSAAGHYDAAS